tara:strand:+ start:610 stop:963 length:354 start_codon:yes stop_codon:yes gene_type:complete
LTAHGICPTPLAALPALSPSIEVKMFHLFQDIVDQSKKGFASYDVSIEDVWPDGWSWPITSAFHWVGRNSSHHFALSTLKDGRILYLTDSWCYEKDGFKKECYVCERERPPSYFGHW